MVDNLLILIHHFYSKYFFVIFVILNYILNTMYFVRLFKRRTIVKIRQNIDSFIYFISLNQFLMLILVNLTFISN